MEWNIPLVGLAALVMSPLRFPTTLSLLALGDFGEF